MRDIIWTVILIWVVWKVYDAFKNVSKAKTQTHGYDQQQNNNYYKREGEIKIENPGSKTKTHFKSEDGEFIDYEEIK